MEERKDAAGLTVESMPAAEEGAPRGAESDCTTPGEMPESRRRQGILTVPEAARYSGLCVGSIRALVEGRVLRSFTPYGLTRPVLVYQADVDTVMRGERP